MEERVDINSEASVQRMFEELLRDHEQAEPMAEPNRLRSHRSIKAPPRRTSMIPAYWPVGDDGARVGELRALLAEPNVLAPTVASLVAPATPTAGPQPQAVGWSLAPVAMASGSRPAPAEPAPPRHLLRWLVPATAGAFAAGAVYAADGLGPAPALASALPAQHVEGAYLLDQGWREAESYAAWTLELMRHPRLMPRVSTFDGFARPPGDADDAASAATRPASLLLSTAAGLHAEPPRPANVRHAAAVARGGRAARSAEAEPTAQAAAAAESEPAAHAEEQPVAVAPPELDPFDRGAALAALQTASGAAAGCAQNLSGTQLVPVSVTFAPSGRVTVAQVGGALAGTTSGSCVARIMRSASVPPFAGSLITVTKTVRFK